MADGVRHPAQPFVSLGVMQMSSGDLSRVSQDLHGAGGMVSPSDVACTLSTNRESVVCKREGRELFRYGQELALGAWVAEHLISAIVLALDLESFHCLRQWGIPG